MYIGEETRPNTFNAIYFVAAIVIHALLFFAIWYIGMRESDEPQEVVIPMELMVVVNENLDGVEDEPPPEKPPAPEPEPEPEPVKPPEPPPPEPEPEVTVPEALVVEPEKPKEPEKLKPPEPPKEVKPKEPEKPKPPMKTREQRLAEIRNSTTKIKNPNPPPRNNGRTEMRPKDWEKLLNAGYRPGPVNKGLDASEEARCLSLIQRAFYSKWDSPAWTSSLRIMHLKVRFGSGGRVLGYDLVQSSGEAAADRTVLRAASLVGSVRGLSPSFLEKFSTVTVRFEVTPE